MTSSSSSSSGTALAGAFDADRSELGCGEFVDAAVTVADRTDVVVVNHDQLAGTTPADVELDGVDAVGPGRVPNRAERVLRVVLVEPAVCRDIHRSRLSVTDQKRPSFAQEGPDGNGNGVMVPTQVSVLSMPASVLAGSVRFSRGDGTALKPA
jgi:hypothetical protein